MSASKPATEKVVFLGDVHFPYQDKVALDLVDEFLAWFKPDFIYLIGDIVDCYQLSSFDKDPRRILGFQDELDQATEWLGRLSRAHPKSKKTLRLGNHERRLDKLLCRVPEISSLDSLSWKKLLKLDELGIELSPYNGRLHHRGFLVEHGDTVSSKSSATAAKMLERRGTSGISGHVHRLGVSYRTNARGTHAWYENGCLCSLQPDYIIGDPDWQQGFTVGHFLKHQDSKRFVIEQVTILDRSLFYAGNYWSA